MSLSFSPYDYEFHNDPYPVYARLRAEVPVYRNDELGFWALSRYDDVVTGLRDFAAFSNANGVMVEPSMWGRTRRTSSRSSPWTHPGTPRCGA